MTVATGGSNARGEAMAQVMTSFAQFGPKEPLAGNSKCRTGFGAPTGPPRQVTSKLVKSVQSLRALERAWRVIRGERHAAPSQKRFSAKSKRSQRMRGIESILSRRDYPAANSVRACQGNPDPQDKRRWEEEQDQISPDCPCAT